MCSGEVLWYGCEKNIAVMRSAKPAEIMRYCDCENLTMKECGSEQSVVQRDKVECFSTVVV